MSLEERLVQHGGCARRRELVRSWPDVDELSALVAMGRVRRVRRGLYALPGAGPDIIAARIVSGAIACVSAAAHLDMRLLNKPRGVHVAVPAHRAAPRSGQLPAGTVMHWTGALPPGARVAPADLAVAHAIGCLPFTEAVALVDGALNERFVRLEDLAAHRPHSGWQKFDRVLRMADGRSQSIPETFMRLGLRAAGLHVEPQVMIDGVGYVDLLVEGSVVVETDGFAYHGDRTAFAEDRRRGRVLTSHGMPELRFTFHDAVLRTAQCVAEVVGVAGSRRRA